MSRYRPKNSFGLEAAIWLSVAAVFGADLFTPLGIAVWVFYLVPVILSLFGWRPSRPLIVALTATLLTAVGFFSDTPGISPLVASVNRLFGIATIWTLSIFGRQFLTNKLAVREQAWLRQGQTGVSAQMQGEMQLGELGERILRYVSEYLELKAITA